MKIRRLHRPPRVLCLLPIPDESIAAIRIITPLRDLCAKGKIELRICTMYFYQPRDIAWADAVVLQRNADEFVISLMNYLQTRKKRIIFEIDDLLTEIPPFLQLHEYGENTKHYLIEILRMADAVTVSTGRLKREIDAYNNSVHVISNCVLWESKKIRHDAAAGNEISLLIVSSDTYKLEFIIQPLRKLMDESVFKLKLIVIGPLVPLLKTAGLSVEGHDRMSYSQFQTFVSSLNNAIGIIPLDNSRFSHCKSAIKFIDYAVAGIPSVCSNVPPYSDVVKHEVTGLLTRNLENDWYQAVRRLVVSADDRRRLASNAYRTCRKTYPLRDFSQLWFDLLQETRAGQGQKGSPMLNQQRNNRDLVLQICNKAASLRTYQILAHMLQQDGLRGLTARLSRFVWAKGDPLHYREPYFISTRQRRDRSLNERGDDA